MITHKENAVLTDREKPYPRVCAHRGFNTIAPENSMPAFGAAVAMGADEIEFDLWWTKDREIVSTHDPVLDRVSDGSGYVYEHTYQELLQYDFGIKTGPAFEGLRILKFEEILQVFARRVIMNIHLKSASGPKLQFVDMPGLQSTDRSGLQSAGMSECQTADMPDSESAAEAGAQDNWIPDGHLEKITALIRKYHAEEYCYFKVGEHDILEKLQVIAPEIARCAGAGSDPHENYAETAMRYGCSKIQLFQPYFAMNPPDYVKNMIDQCHSNGIRVNYFWTDDPQEAVDCIKSGVDTVLTNDYHRVASAVARAIIGSQPQ